MITTSGGGALITPDEDSWREKIGYNYRMSNICAGIEARPVWKPMHGGHVSASRPIRD